MERAWYRNALVELVGTFALIFVGGLKAARRISVPRGADFIVGRRLGGLLAAFALKAQTEGAPTPARAR